MGKGNCAFMSSRTAIITIGFISMMLSGLSFAFIVYLVRQMNERLQSLIFPEEIKQLETLRMDFLILAVYLFFQTTLAIMMITGAQKKRPSYIFPWLALNFSTLIGVVCFFIGFGIARWPYLTGSGLIRIIAASIIAGILALRLWYIVYSFYQQVAIERIVENLRVALQSQTPSAPA